jgi:hypothetical protein
MGNDLGEVNIEIQDGGITGEKYFDTLNTIFLLS